MCQEEARPCGEDRHNYGKTEKGEGGCMFSDELQIEKIPLPAYSFMTLSSLALAKG